MADTAEPGYLVRSGHNLGYLIRKVEEGLPFSFNIASKLDSSPRLQDAFDHAPAFKDRVSRKVVSVIPKDVKDIVESRRRWLLLVFAEAENLGFHFHQWRALHHREW